MINRTSLLTAAAAALVLSTPLFAHDHGDAHPQHGAAGCPHHQATSAAVSQAITLLEQAAGQSGDAVQATVGQARQQLAEAQKQMGACQEMCAAKMEAHAAGGHQCPMHAATPAANTEMVTDPVCGMKIDPKTAAGKSTYAGKTYYFCSKDEKEKFDKDPEKYLKTKV